MRRVFAFCLIVAALSAGAPVMARIEAGQSAAIAPDTVVQAIQAALGRSDLAGAAAAIEPALRRYPDDAVLHNFAGVVAAQRGDTAAAAAQFERAIALAPRSAAAYANLGRLYQEAADPAQRRRALAVYARLLAALPANVEGHYQSALLFAVDGRFEDAATHLAALPADVQARAQVLALRTVVLAGAGQAAAARASAETLAAHPSLVAADVLAVLPACERLPNDDVALALLRLLDARGWAGAPEWRRLAALEARAGAFPRARTLLEQVAAAEPTSVPVLVDLARYAFKAGDAKGALGYLAHARELAPNEAQVHFLFGIVCVELNLGAEAHTALARAVALAPDDPSINYAMGAVSMHRHEPTESLPYFERYLRLKPGDPRGRFALGAARYYCQQLDAARADLLIAAAAPETATGAHYYLARIARQQQDLETARREIDRALAAKADYADAWAERGLIETRLGDYAAAQAALDKAFALDPRHYEATLNQAALYGRVKDPRKAEAEQRLATLVAEREVRAQEFLRLVQVVP